MNARHATVYQLQYVRFVAIYRCYYFCALLVLQVKRKRAYDGQFFSTIN